MTRRKHELGWLIATIWVTILGSSCNVGEAIDDDGSVCAEARALFHSCGTSLSIIEVQACSGAAKAAARCVVDHADSCETLVTLRLDQCLMDAFDTDGEEAPFDPVPFDPGQGLPDGSDGGPGPEPSPEEGNEACADGIDNDVDGFVDCADVACSQDPQVTVCGP